MKGPVIYQSALIPLPSPRKPSLLPPTPLSSFFRVVLSVVLYFVFLLFLRFVFVFTASVELAMSEIDEGKNN